MDTTPLDQEERKTVIAYSHAHITMVDEAIGLVLNRLDDLDLTDSKLSFLPLITVIWKAHTIVLTKVLISTSKSGVSYSSFEHQMRLLQSTGCLRLITRYRPNTLQPHQRRSVN